MILCLEQSIWRSPFVKRQCGEVPSTREKRFGHSTILFFPHKTRTMNIHFSENNHLLATLTTDVKQKQTAGLKILVYTRRIMSVDKSTITGWYAKSREDKGVCSHFPYFHIVCQLVVRTKVDEFKEINRRESRKHHKI